MELERAIEIVQAINARMFFAMDLCERNKVPPIGMLSLTDMLKAVRVVEERNAKEKERADREGGGYSTFTVPAERLVAAVYALENFEPSDEGIIAKPSNLFSDENIVLGVVRIPLVKFENENDG